MKDNNRGSFRWKPQLIKNVQRFDHTENTKSNEDKILF